MTPLQEFVYNPKDNFEITKLTKNLNHKFCFISTYLCTKCYILIVPTYMFIKNDIICVCIHNNKHLYKMSNNLFS